MRIAACEWSPDPARQTRPPGPPGVTSRRSLLTSEASWLILRASGSPSVRHVPKCRESIEFLGSMRGW